MLPIASIVVCLSVPLSAPVDSAQTGPLKLIPTPQSAVRQDGVFDIANKAAVVLGDAKNADDRFAAEQLRDCMKLYWGKSLSIRARSNQRVLIGQIGRDKAIDEAIAGLTIEKPNKDAHDAYILWVKPNEVVVAGYTAAGTFYGVQTLKQLVKQSTKLPCLQISDWAALKYRGWQDDVSRGPIPTLDYLKKQVRILSEFKQNCMTLYTEHIFKLKKHPTIAPADGITAAEIKELSTYAKKFHIELIGNFQSFGHFANILNVKGYGHLGEAGWVLSPAKEESYQFLKDVYSEIAPAYESALFNINCDETGGLGDGASKEMVQKIGLAGVYAKHINRVADLLRPLGKTPMMWGDIAQQHPDIVPQLPKDLIVMSWGYHAGNNFDYAIVPFTKLGLRFWVCPGVSCWGQVFPDYRNASINISNYVRDGYRNGAMGMLNTTWDDDGENLFSYNWLPLIWGGECSWNPALPASGDWNEERGKRYEQFLDAFDSAFYGEDNGTAYTLSRLSQLRDNPVSGGMSDGAYWMSLDEVGRQRGSLTSAQDLVKEADSIIASLKAAKTKSHADALDYAIYAARRARFMGMRSLGVQLLDSAADDKTVFRGAVAAFKDLVSEAESLRAEYIRLWKDENRNWWLDRNLARFDSQIKDLKSVLNGPIVSPRGLTFQDEVQVRMSSLVPGQEIRYTLDGSEPTANSPVYSSPITLSKTTHVKVRAFADGKPAGEVVEQVYRTTPLPARIQTNMHPYDGHIALYAWDGDPSSFFWREGPLQEGDWLSVTFPSLQQVQEIVVPTGHPDGGRDQLQSGVLEASEDGKTWTYSAPFEKGTATLKLGGKRIMGFRIRATASQSFWLAVREITVR